MSTPPKAPIDTGTYALSATNELAHELLRLSAIFRRYGLGDPPELVLKSAEAGNRLVDVLHAGMRADPFHHLMRDGPLQPRGGSDGAGQSWNKVELAGLTIRWPATQKVTPDGHILWY